LRALAEASAATAYVYGEDFTTPWQEEFAERLLDVFAVRGGAVYFVSGGSEANETAIKMAREYHLQRGQPQRHKIIARWQSFHGVTLGTLSVSGRTAWRGAFSPYSYHAPHIVPPVLLSLPVPP
jgi:adenosylmethionine-8-amino-7-oxononanoate aminotransferase